MSRLQCFGVRELAPFGVRWLATALAWAGGAGEFARQVVVCISPTPRHHRKAGASSRTSKSEATALQIWYSAPNRGASMIRPLASLAVALCLSTAPGFAADETPPRRSIAVTGEGQVKVAPDLAILSFAVETTAPAAAAAVAENARESTTLSDALKKQIGTSGKVSTTGYSVEPVYEQRERGSGAAPPRITGYVARNQVRAETHAIDGLGKLIDAATQAGANRIDGLDFTLEERAKAQSDALQRAGEDARR